MSTPAKILLPLLLMVYALAGGIASASDSTSDVNSRAVRCGAIEQTYLYYSPDQTHPLTGRRAPPRRGRSRREHGRRLEASRPRKRKPSCWLRSCPATPNSRMPPLASSAAWLRTRVRSLASTRSACICSEIRVGGYLAFDGAMFESQYFAAVAVHANRIADEYTGILARAQRKTPIGDLYRRSRPVFHRCQRAEDPRPPAQVRISRALCRTDKS